MNTIYIAGAISNNKDYVRDFSKANMKLRKDWVVLDPTRLPNNLPYNSYFPICTAMINVSDAVYMLKSWTKSAGAKVERDYAILCGKEILYE